MPVKNEKSAKKKVNFTKVLAAAGAILFVAGFGVRYLSFNAGISRFRQQCRAARRGEKIEDIQQRALMHGLYIAVDDDPRPFGDEGYYVLKPWADWPRQFSCRIHVKFGRVVVDD